MPDHTEAQIEAAKRLRWYADNLHYAQPTPGDLRGFADLLDAAASLSPPVAEPDEAMLREKVASKAWAWRLAAMLRFLRERDGECLGDHPRWMADIDALLVGPTTTEQAEFDFTLRDLSRRQAAGWTAQERADVHEALTGSRGPNKAGGFIANLGPYVRSVVSDLNKAEDELATLRAALEKLPPQYRKEPWSVEYDHHNEEHFVCTAGQGVFRCEEFEVAEALCAVVNARPPSWFDR